MPTPVELLSLTLTALQAIPPIIDSLSKKMFAPKERLDMIRNEFNIIQNQITSLQQLLPESAKLIYLYSELRVQIKASQVFSDKLRLVFLEPTSLTPQNLLEYHKQLRDDYTRAFNLIGDLTQIRDQSPKVGELQAQFTNINEKILQIQTLAGNPSSENLSYFRINLDNISNGYSKIERSLSDYIREILRGFNRSL